MELKQLPTFAERCKLMLDRLNKLRDDPERDFYIDILKQEKDGELIVDVYEKLGVEVFANKKYQRADIKKELDKSIQNYCGLARWLYKKLKTLFL